MMERDKFKKIAAQTGDPKDYADYKSLRNEVVYKLRHAEKDYLKSSLVIKMHHQVKSGKVYIVLLVLSEATFLHRF